MDKQLPYDIAAERATLGALLLERDAILVLDAWLRPDMFWLQKHEWIYRAIVACAHRREPPDVATVATELRRNDQLDAIGGYSFLGDLASEVPTAVHVEYYAHIVEECALRRALIAAGGDIVALGYETKRDLGSVLDAAEQRIFGVSQRQQRGDFAPLGTVMSQYFEALSELQRNERATVGVPTGYADLDELTGGMHPSDLIIMAARPSVGKTSLALSMAYEMAEMDYRVGILSLEMSNEQLGQRLLSIHTGVPLQDLRNGRVADLDAIIRGMGEIDALPLYLDDTPSLSISQARAKARRLQSQRGIDILFIDYLQLMTGSYRDNRVLEVSEISRGLKGLARELRIPVVVLSQLSRAVEGRSDPIPRLSDLRDSGAIEQDADIVMFPFRPILHDKNADPSAAELHIAKHRNGPLGVVSLTFDSQTTRLRAVERYRGVEGY